jgi:hypothetical protein
MPLIEFYFILILGYVLVNMFDLGDSSSN